MNRRGEQCRKHAMKGSTQCRNHGGASLVGVSSPNFRHGRYSKQIPTRLAARYHEALADPQLLELRDEIALVETRQAELLTHLDSNSALRHWQAAGMAYMDVCAAIRLGDAPSLQAALPLLGNALEAGHNDYAVWHEILETMELRRRLVDSEHKRLVAMQQMLSVEQAMALVATVTEIVRRNVDDPAVLVAIAGELREILNRRGPYNE